MTRLAIVAGAGSGLGQATALALFEAGLTVVAIDRTEAGLERLPKGIHTEVAEATDPAVPTPLVERIVDEMAPPDVLVNTIGSYALGDLMSTTAETLAELIEINLGPAMWLTQAVVPHMKARGSGAIVHVSAKSGLEPSPGLVAYGCSKAALLHLTRTMDAELREHHIRVNAVVPEVIATAKNKALLPAEALVGAVEPEAIAKVVAFLASEDAGAVSGAIVPTYG
jgi:NAD(P)-dependent dehydrogenase (short-subunit alcohol dehydrogenase family)